MEIEVGPFGANDRLVVNGPLAIGGNSTLRLELSDGFTPAVGDTFDILDAQTVTGSFTNMELPALSEGQWDFELL